MQISKKAAILSLIYILTAMAVLGGFIWAARMDAEALELEAEYSYDRAFSELSSTIGDMSTALRKVQFASSPAMVSSTCAEAYAKAVAARQAISGLPYGYIKLEHTSAFISKVGDYMFYLTRSSAAGKKLTADDREALKKLSAGAQKVSETMNMLTAQIISGSLSLSELKAAENAVMSAEGTARNVSSGIEQMEADFPEIPTLIYDGPFSEHISRMSPALLYGEEEISQEDAISAAARFSGQNEKDFTVQYVRDDSIPVYVVTRQSGENTETYEITRSGGKVLYFGTSHESNDGGISSDDAVKIAEKFLADRGFKSLRTTYWESDFGQTTVNFAYDVNGVICYPDLVKVTVAQDTGAIISYEAKGYIMCHTYRSALFPAISEDDAKASLSPELNVKSHKLAVIPTNGKYEVFCHEFLCEDSEGQQCLVYINADTGAEEDILLLLTSENGTLTI